MNRPTSILCVLWLLATMARAQCGLEVLSYQDSLCTDVEQVIVDDSLYAGSIGIDLSHEVFYTLDTAYDFSAVSTTIGDPTNSVSCVQDTNGNWYGFTKAPNMNSVVRFDFGSSLLNTPTKTTIYTYPTSYTLNTGTRGGIRFVRTNGQWYGVTTLVAGRIAIMKFDGGLAADTVEVDVHFDGTYFPSPSDLDIEVVDDSIVVVVLNSGGQIASMNLGPDLTWPPVYGSVIDPVSALDLSAGRAIEVIEDCGSYHVFATGITRRKLNHLTYGASLFNPSPSYTVDESNLNYPTQIRSSHAGPVWQVWVKHRNLGFSQYQYPPGLTSLDSALNYTSSTYDINGDGFDLVYSKGKHRAVTMSQNKVLTTVVFDEASYGQDTLLPGDSITTTYSTEGAKWGTVVYRDTFGLQRFTPFFTWVRSSPAADFSASSFCFGDSTSFADLSTGIQGIDAWMWDFGDSTSSTLSDPIHAYQDTGGYQVQLHVTDSNGCTDVQSSFIQIAPLPSAAIWHSLPCQGEDIVFVDSSSHFAFTSLDSTAWVFQDSIYQSGMATTYYASDSTEVTVTLYTFSDFGCVDSSTVIVDILPSPVVNVNIDSTCFGDTVRFTNLTSSAVPFTSLWAFGDGDSAATFDASHYYPDTGTYSLIFAATSTGLCSDTFTLDLRVSLQPELGIGFPAGNVCTYESVVFTEESTLFGDSLLASLWVFDGDTHATTDWQAQFSSPVVQGNLFHEVVVGTACRAGMDTLLNVLPGIRSQYEVGSTCLGDSTDFTFSGEVPAGQSVSASTWTFGDGNGAANFEPTHTYTDSGFFEVSIVQVTDSGCEGQWDTTLRVGQRPFIDFTLSTPVCTDVPIAFTTEESFDPYDQVITDQWILYGDTIDLNDDLQTDSGGANVPLTRHVMTSLGCDITRVNLVKIGNTPVAHIAFDTTCAQTRMELSDAYSGTNYAWHWTIDGQYELFIDDPGFVFQSPGLYPVSLDVTEVSSGCVGYGDTMVVVSGVDSTALLHGTLCHAQRNAFSLAANLSYDRFDTIHWTINGTSFIGQEISPMITAQDVDMEVNFKTVHGCEATLVGSDTVRVLNEIDPSISAGAQPLELEFSLRTSPWMQSASWMTEGASYDGFTAQHLYSDPGFYTLTVQYADTFGCATSYKRLVTAGQPEVDVRIERLVVQESMGSARQIQVTVSNYSQLEVDSVTIDFRGNTGLMIREGFHKGIDPGGQRILTFRSQLVGDTSTQYCAQIHAVGNILATDGDELCILTDAEDPIGDFYPNPTSGGSSIVLDLPSGTLVDVFVSSTLGKLVLHQEVEVASGGQRDPYFLDVSTLGRGTYSVEFVDRNNPSLRFVRKLIKI